MLVVSDRARARLPGALAGADTEALTRRFYATLRDEVRDGRADLDQEELALLRGHYPVMMRPDRYPPDLVATIYAERREPAVREILRVSSGPAAVVAGSGVDPPAVFDAGCGFGSESFLFAAVGARVVAVDRSPEQIAIARKRHRYYEELFERELDVTFHAADLEGFRPGAPDLHLTWLSSVLANLRDQERFLSAIARQTGDGGRVMITDMNLLNPLFAFNEWRRRRSLARRSPEFAHHASFWRMFWRAGRDGARYFPAEVEGGAVDDGKRDETDDAQFFWSRTLSGLLRRAGFVPTPARYSGFALPFRYVPGIGSARLSELERLCSRIPGLARGGYFYLQSGIRTDPGNGPGHRATGDGPE